MSALSQLLSIRSARQLDRISSASGISLERLTELAGGQEPAMAEVRLLSKQLRVSMEDLLPSEGVDRAEMLFRRSLEPNAALPSGAVIAAKRMASFQGLRINRNHQIQWRQAFSPAQPTIGHAELNARIFRDIFYNGDQLSPITVLPRIVGEQMNVFLYVLSSVDFDGASAIIDDQAFTFVAASFAPRMLFTLAHEVGHLVAHHHGEAFAIVDEDIEGAAQGGDAEMEAYANAFASALLMPRESVGVALRTVRRTLGATADQLGDVEILYLSRIYGTSFWAAARRCEDLDMLPRGGAAALNEVLVRNHGSAEQRADEIGLPERPPISFPVVPPSLMEAAIAGVRAGDFSIGKAASSLGIAVSDLVAANAPTRH